MGGGEVKMDVSSKDRVVEMVIFELNGKEYAIPVIATKEVIKMTAIVAIPNTLDFVAGVLNLRGHILCVIDLRKQFHFPSKHTDECRIMVVRMRGMVVGLIVDSVREVMKVMKSQIDPIPPILKLQISDHCLVGIAKVKERIITLLNLENILSPDQWGALHQSNVESVPVEAGS